MKLLAVMASGATGGGASHLRLLLPALAAQGIEVRAAVGTDGPLAEVLAAAGIQTDVLDLMRSRIDPKGPFALAALARRRAPDLVHYHGTRAAFFGAVARPLGRRRPAVYSAHGLAYRQSSGRLRALLLMAAERLACAAADHVISVSRPDLVDLTERGFVRPEHVSHIENPVDPLHFAPGMRETARRVLGLAERAFVAVSVARLVPQKAVMDLVLASAACRRPLEIVVIGDGPERGPLEAEAAARQAPVRFVGERRDVPALWPAFDAFVLSSHWEGEPMALLEAMAAGLPCIATDTGAAHDLLAGGAGRLVPVGRPMELAQTLDGLSGLSPHERRALGAEARSRVALRTPARIAARHIEVYEEVLGRLRRRGAT
jgi:glycosyltransferase involved in cell wall biosynthesis